MLSEFSQIDLQERYVEEGLIVDRRMILDLKEIAVDTRNWFDSAQVIGYWRALVNGYLISIPLSYWTRTGVFNMICPLS